VTKKGRKGLASNRRRKIRKEKKSKELPSHNELSEGFMLGLAQGLSEDIGPV
jgi:hypothetical protein